MDDSDGIQPLDDPRQEAVAQFFAAPEQLRKFKSVTALAEHLGVSRMTIYRWHDDVKLQQRIKRLLKQKMRFGNYLMCREWPRIVRAQIAAALGGSTQAATFCEKRAWRDSMFDTYDLLIGDVEISASCLEAEEELDAAKESPENKEDKNSTE